MSVNAINLLNKKKIVNNPVYGFIDFPASKIFDVVEHPYFQRLRRIKQLGLTDFVYPGAIHTRFHHALGATNLMQMALDVLKAKGQDITKDETEGAYLAILLHDIGHVNFYITKNQTIHFQVNSKKLSNSKLKMDVMLLNYAAIVE